MNCDLLTVAVTCQCPADTVSAQVAAARARATVGEITQAMEEVFGRHVATDKFVSGAYKSEYADTEDLQKVMQRVCQNILWCLILWSWSSLIFIRHSLIWQYFYKRFSKVVVHSND